MTAALEGSEWSAACPGRTLPPGKDPVPILQEAGWAPGPAWTGGKSRPQRDSIPVRPALSQSLNQLSCPVHIPLVHSCIKGTSGRSNQPVHIPLVHSCIKGTSGRSNQKQLLKTPRLSGCRHFLIYTNFTEEDFIF